MSLLLMQTFYFLPIFQIKMGSAMSPKKEARLLKVDDKLIENGRKHKLVDVQDFGNRIVVKDEAGSERRFNIDDDVEVE